MSVSGFAIGMGTRSFSLICILLLATISFASATDFTVNCPESTDNQFLTAQRVDHQPIRIHNNSQLLLDQSINGWPGSGTPDSPIEISDYRIENNDIGIWIEHVTLAFIIHNCETNNWDTSYWDSIGIWIRNCTYGAILDSYVHMKEVGIKIEDSDNITIYQTTTHDCHTGVSIFNSSNILLDSNNLGWNDYIGVIFNQTENCWITNNLLIALPDYGIICTQDNFTSIMDCVITGAYLGDNQFSHNGIVSLSSRYLDIHRVDIVNCIIGIELFETRHTIVLDCNIANNTDYGLYLHPETYNVSILSNHFGPENGINAYDDGYGNDWYYNYWSDYSGSGYYFIPGLDESIDTEPHTLRPPISSAPPTTTSTTSTAIGDDFLFRLILSFGIGFELVVISYLLCKRQKSS